jgi:hypothetical protein
MKQEKLTGCTLSLLLLQALFFCLQALLPLSMEYFPASSNLRA